MYCPSIQDQLYRMLNDMDDPGNKPDFTLAAEEIGRPLSRDERTYFQKIWLERVGLSSRWEDMTNETIEEVRRIRDEEDRADLRRVVDDVQREEEINERNDYEYTGDE